MRPGPLITGAIDNPSATSPAPSSIDPHTVWHSPVPYLFGGLAVMLGMIVVALLVLACSYWRLSGYLNSVEAASDRERNSGARNGGDKISTNGEGKEIQLVGEHVMVIMAGDEKPTFLATHANQKDDGGNCNSSSSNISNVSSNINSSNEELNSETRQSEIEGQNEIAGR